MSTSSPITINRSAFPATLKFVNVTYTGASSHILVPAVTSKLLKIWMLDLFVSGDSTVELFNGTTSFTQALSLLAGGHLQYGFFPLIPSTNFSRSFVPYTCSLETDFKVTLGSAVTIAGIIWYEEAAP